MESTVVRSVVLGLDRFGRETVANAADRHSVRPGELLSSAALYYLAERGGGRFATAIPRFVRPGPREEAPDSRLGAELDLEGAAWEALERAAKEQGVDLPTLITHAAMLYVADLESGRVADRFLQNG